MKLLSWYVIRLFIKAYVAFFAAISLIVFIFHFAELQKRTTSHLDIDMWVKVKLAFLRTPYIVEQITPFLVFIVGLFIFWRLNRQHELEVVRSVGMSIWRFIFPLCLFVVGFGALELAILNPMNSAMMTKHARLEAHYFHKDESGVKVSSSGIWLSEVENGRQRIYNIRRVDLKKGELHQVTILNFDDQHRFTSRYNANSALLEGGKLRLKEGWFLEKGALPQKIDALSISTKLTKKQIENTDAHRSKISFWYLPSYIELLKSSGLYSLKYEVYFQMLLARSFWYGAMVLLAASFMVQPTRGGRTLPLLLAGLLTGFLLYFMRDMSYALGAGGELPPLLAAWGTPLITCLMALMLMLYQEDRSL